MVNPEAVCSNYGYATRFHLLHLASPVLRWHTHIVYLTHHWHLMLTVDNEALGIHLKGVSLWISFRAEIESLRIQRHNAEQQRRV